MTASMVFGVQRANVKKYEREALICAIVAFPLMLMASVGLDVALVIVSLYPNVTYFIGFESVMPAYYAYRTLLEVVLEAIPQVCYCWLQHLRCFTVVTAT
jgi:hypothetical protein